MPVVPASASIHNTRWAGVAGRASRFTRALAVAIPTLTRSEINDDADSAIAPMMVNIALPMGLAVAT